MRTTILAWHCELCGSTNPEDVGGREDGRYYSGCCNEKIVTECGSNCDHERGE